MKIIIAFCLFALLAAGLYAQEELWGDRTTAAKVEKAYQWFKAQHRSSPSYAAAWKFARAAHYFASQNIPEKDADARKLVFEEGKLAAQKARELEPGGVEGHYYFGICLGSWAEANGVLASLFAVNDLLAAMESAARIDERFEKASPLMTRARLYQKAPGWPLSIGDKKRSDADYRRVIELAPDNRVAHRFYAEQLGDEGRKSEARAIIDKGLAIPIDPTNTVQDKSEMEKLEVLRAKL
jgi:hypothetical protein